MKLNNLDEINARLRFRPVPANRNFKSVRRIYRSEHMKGDHRGASLIAHEDFYDAFCGFKSSDGHQCSGSLGRVRIYRSTGGYIPAITANTLHNRRSGEELAEGDWYVTHPEGLYDARDGRHGVMTRKRGKPANRGGRRPIPAELKEHGGSDYQVLGERPRVPCVIYCPECNRPNRICIPPSGDIGG